MWLQVSGSRDTHVSAFLLSWPLGMTRRFLSCKNIIGTKYDFITDYFCWYNKRIGVKQKKCTEGIRETLFLRIPSLPASGGEGGGMEVLERISKLIGSLKQFFWGLGLDSYTRQYVPTSALYLFLDKIPYVWNICWGRHKFISSQFDPNYVTNCNDIINNVFYHLYTNALLGGSVCLSNYLPVVQF